LLKSWMLFWCMKCFKENSWRLCLRFYFEILKVFDFWDVVDFWIDWIF
jgi:hypothetical protein